jgi:hypothetical protein
MTEGSRLELPLKTIKNFSTYQVVLKFGVQVFIRIIRAIVIIYT